MNKLSDYLSSFKGKKIAVIGDLMLDSYIVGDTNRISPEAPVIVLQVNKEYSVPGGAANVATNLKALGAEVSIIGIVGNDVAGKILNSLLAESGINCDISLSESPTIQKTRLLCRNQHVVRYDKEMTFSENPLLMDKVKRMCESADLVILSDYAKGTISKEIAEYSIKNAKVLVDPKPRNMTWYKGAFAIKPNVGEAEEVLKTKAVGAAAVDALGKQLSLMLDSNIVLTRGGDGVSVFEKGGQISHIPGHPVAVSDVTGAGDTLVAALAMGIAAGAPLKDAAELANIAGSLKVAKAGTAVVSIEELKSYLDRQ